MYRFLQTVPVLSFATLLASQAGAATIVTNNTGLSSSTFVFLDYESQTGTTTNGVGSMVSTRGGGMGNDGDANAFGDLAGYATTGAVTYTFTGLVVGQTYNLYANWYGNGTDNCALGVTANGTSLGIFNQKNVSSGAGTGFTAWNDLNDTVAETKGFALLGSAVADSSGNITIVAGLGDRQYFRNDAMAIAPVPEPSALLSGSFGVLSMLMLRRRK
ncbi:MAG: hypothetical protein QM755_15435 [Luteolibacter sp.]